MCEGNLVAGARTPQLRMRSLLTQHHWPGRVVVLVMAERWSSSAGREHLLTQQ